MTNAYRAPYECVIRRGSTVIARKRRVAGPLSAGRDTWECLDMKVPESNDGKVLKLTVTVTAGASKVSASRTFIGR